MSLLADRPGAIRPLGPHGRRLPAAGSVRFNPSASELQELTARMPQARRTAFGNYNVQTRVLSRSNGSTYIVTDTPELHSQQAISRAEGDRVARLQDEYIARTAMIVLDGYIGNEPDHRSRARLYIEEANANIAGMQRQLYFEPDSSGEDWEPELCIIYTPNLPMPDYPDQRLIAVDLDAGITRVMNSDYFGESKKGGLRMWNERIYNAGGLALHAGCKAIPTADGEKVMLIIGLSGTGKTTTTFTRQNDSRPVQDDFVGLFGGGRVIGTENGCFAKTFGLNQENEPAIYGAVIRPEAYLENVSQRGEQVDFFDTSYTQNGRATFPMEALGIWKDPREVASVDYLLILNRNENIIPAIARLAREQAAAYFMLGETQGTSAGGAAEAGKFLRVPGTNPFFPLRHEQQANRFLELLDSSDFSVYLVNTGRVGGREGNPASKKVQIRHSGAIVEALAEGTITWERDPDFGYEVASGVPGIEDEELLQPRRLYERLGRRNEYEQFVVRFKRERVEFLRRFEGLRPEIVEAVA